MGTSRARRSGASGRSACAQRRSTVSFVTGSSLFMLFPSRHATAARAEPLARAGKGPQQPVQARAVGGEGPHPEILADGEGGKDPTPLGNGAEAEPGPWVGRQVRDGDASPADVSLAGAE